MEMSLSYARLLDLDPLEQRATRQIRVSLWRAGQKIAEEEHTLLENLYFRNEVLLMLGKVGFRDVGVYSGYSGALMTSEQTMVIFVARK